MKVISVGKNDIGRRIDNFLFALFCKIPKTLIYKFIRKKKVKVNSKKVNENYRLKENDTINLYLNDEILESKVCKDDFLSAPSDIDVIYEDKNILLINKKIGLVCQPDNKNIVDCVINRAKKYLLIKGEYKFDDENIFAPSLVNRIDRNTEGIVIISKNLESLKFLNEKIKNREIKKYYKCLVHGKMPKDKDIITAFLYKNCKENKAYIYDKYIKNSKIIKTKYEVIRYKSNLSYLKIDLLTGRFHQIRAHLAHIGHPIVGDGKYGQKENYKKQLLVSYKIKFNFKKGNPLIDYLNNKSFTINRSEVIHQIEKLLY